MLSTQEVDLAVEEIMNAAPPGAILVFMPKGKSKGNVGPFDSTEEELYVGGLGLVPPSILLEDGTPIILP